jgi:putative cell wall-binding protein
MSRLSLTAARRAVAVVMAAVGVAGGLTVAEVPASAAPTPSVHQVAAPTQPAPALRTPSPVQPALIAPAGPAIVAGTSTGPQLPVFGGTSVVTSTQPTVSSSSQSVTAATSSTASAGGSSESPVLAALDPTLPPPAAQTVTRIVGVDQLEIAISVSQHSFPSAGSAGAVVLASENSYADALSAAPLAAAHDAPLLLTPGTALDPAVAAEITRVLPAAGTVFLLGGDAALSPAIQTQLGSDGFQVIRLGGADRYATALKVADALGDPTTVMLASGLNFPDGLTGSVAAAHVHGALLLTAGTSLPPAVAAYLTAHPGAVTAVGGPAAKAAPTANPIVGSDRYATAALVAAAFYSNPTFVGIASGADFSDALAAGAQLAIAGGPLVLSAPSNLAATSTTYLQSIRSSAATIEIYGGTDMLRDAVAVEIDTAVIEPAVIEPTTQ